MDFAEFFGIFILASNWVIVAITWADVGGLKKLVNKQNDLFTEILNQCRIINGCKPEQESDSDA